MMLPWSTIFLLWFLTLLPGRKCSDFTSCPSFCYCDESSLYVSCVGDGLSALPTVVPKGAMRLEFRNFAAAQLSATDLQNFGIQLKETVIQRVQLQYVENATFSSFTNLEHLDLSQNRLENITRATFEGMVALRYLDLSSNHIETLDYAFVDLNNVEQLNLRDNRLPVLTPVTFQGLHKVQYLNLDANAISSIDVATFQDLIYLAHLILSSNPLVQLSRLDFFGSRLQFLDMSHVGLQRVPQSLTRFVRDLRLAKNNLTEIRRGDFDSYPHIGLLVLDDNSIGNIEDDALGRLEFLQRLWLNGNKLTAVPQNLPPSLKALYLEENKLTSLRAHEFHGLGMLEQLFLQRNQIEEIQACTFCDLVSLRNLDLQANSIESIPEGTFTNLSNLETLDLSQNPLRTFGKDIFLDFSSLKVLQLSRLKYSVTFDDSLFDPLQRLEILELYNSPYFTKEFVQSTRSLHGVRNIRELNLMHNNLETLRPDFPSFFPQLKTLKMSENEWDCRNNSMLWVAQWILAANIQFFKASRVTCAKPEQYVGFPVFVFHDTMVYKSTTIETTSSPIETTTNQTFENTTVNSQIEKQQNVTPNSNISSSFNFENTTIFEVPVSTFQSSTPSSTTTVEVPSTSLTTEYHTSTHQPQVNNNLDREDTTSTYTLPTTKSVTKKVVFITTVLKKQVTKKPIYLKPLTSTPIIVKPTKKILLIHQSQKEKLFRIADPAVESIHPNDYSHPVFSVKPIPTEGTPTVQSVPLDQSSSNQEPLLIVATIVATSLGLLLLGTTLILAFYRYRNKGLWGGGGTLTHFLTCRKRRGSAISYLPQRDEVHIVTVSEGSVGLQTDNYSGLENKLYFTLDAHRESPRDIPTVGFSSLSQSNFDDLRPL